MNKVTARKEAIPSPSDGKRQAVAGRKSKKAALEAKLPSISDLIFSNSSQAIAVTDERGAIVSANPAFSNLTGFQIKAADGRMISEFFPDRKSAAALNAALSKSGEWHGMTRIEQSNGEQHTVFLNALACRREDDPGRVYLFSEGNHSSIIMSGRGAWFDMLTRLPNRRAFSERLAGIIARSKSNDSFCAILVLDVNRFHSINDSIGFANGDQLLRLLADRLTGCTREIDTVFRLGSDEFALIVDNVSHPEDVSLIAKRLLSACAPPFRLSNQEVYVTFSIGISIFPGDGITIEQLLKSAHAALQRAEEFGVNHFQTYHPAMNSKVVEEFRLDNDLRKALQQDELMLFFQPQIDLTAGGICGAEALIRWMHPQRGVISPVQFVHLAESNGLIIPMGEWVLREACKQMKKWQEQYSQKLYVAVNLSNQQFLQADLADRVAGILEETGFDPSSLELEITETVGMKNPEATLKTLKKLKSMGIHIAIDDFGTGYSSIYYLKKFPIDTIKIDRSFVDDMATDPNAATIVLTMIAMARHLDLSIIAEGVETRAQLDYLLGAGCSKIQGFFYSPPVSAPAFARLLKEPETLENTTGISRK